MSDFAAHYEKAKSLIDSKDVASASSILEKIVSAKDVSLSEEDHKFKEKAIQSLAEIYAEQKRAADLSGLLRSLKPYFDEIPKTKTYKIVRTLIDLLSELDGTEQQIIQLCKEYIEWTDVEKRSFLRQRLESRLAAAYFRAKEYQAALTLLSKLTREVKRLDDKPLLVEIFLLESRIHHALSHLPKSRAALTAARTNANAIYCPPLLQADLDMQSATLHCDEKDYKTAYSYFYESFENLNTLGDPRAVQCLKWMLLCKIMTNIAEDVQALINGKLALRFAGSELEAMRAIASAHSNSSLKQFKNAIETYKHELQEDPLIHRHLNALYDTLLEQNLLRIIEPFSQVQITHAAELIELPAPLVERKFSQMILDKKFRGILDQGNNCLIVFDEPEVDQTYHHGLSTVTSMGRVVDRLYKKAAKLS